MMSNFGDHHHHLPEADPLLPHTSLDPMGLVHHTLPGLHAGGDDPQTHPLFTDGLGSSPVHSEGLIGSIFGDHPLFQDHKSHAPSPSDMASGAHDDHHSNLTFGTGYYENSPVSGEKLYHCPDGHVYDLNGNKVK